MPLLADGYALPPRKRQSGGSSKSGGAGAPRRGTSGGSRGPAPSPRRARPSGGNIPYPSAPNPRPPISPPGRGPGNVPAISRSRNVPGLNKFLAGDDVYQQALRGGKRTLRDFLSELNRRRGEAKVSFGQTTEQMERDRTRGLSDLESQFASRGLLQSGIYGQEVGNFQQDFATQMQQLSQANKQLLADILSQETGFKREQQLAMELARQEALARRAARYNIGV